MGRALTDLEVAGLVAADLRGQFQLTADAWVRFDRLLVGPGTAVTEPVAVTVPVRAGDDS